LSRYIQVYLRPIHGQSPSTFTQEYPGILVGHHQIPAAAFPLRASNFPLACPGGIQVPEAFHPISIDHHFLQVGLCQPAHVSDHRRGKLMLPLGPTTSLRWTPKYEGAHAPSARTLRTRVKYSLNRSNPKGWLG
jgi:hypothetical protein